MVVHRLHRDDQLRGDLLVGVPGHHQRQHLPLARRQPRRVRPGRGPRPGRHRAHPQVPHPLPHPPRHRRRPQRVQPDQALAQHGLLPSSPPAPAPPRSGLRCPPTARPPSRAPPAAGSCTARRRPGPAAAAPVSRCSHTADSPRDRRSYPRAACVASSASTRAAASSPASQCASARATAHRDDPLRFSETVRREGRLVQALPRPVRAGAGQQCPERGQRDHAVDRRHAWLGQQVTARRDRLRPAPQLGLLPGDLAAKAAAVRGDVMVVAERDPCCRVAAGLDEAQPAIVQERQVEVRPAGLLVQPAVQRRPQGADELVLPGPAGVGEDAADGVLHVDEDLGEPERLGDSSRLRRQLERVVAPGLVRRGQGQARVRPCQPTRRTQWLQHGQRLLGGLLRRPTAGRPPQSVRQQPQ